MSNQSIELTAADLHRVGKMTAAERAQRLRYVDKELEQCQSNLRILRIKNNIDRTDYRERRIQSLEDEIEHITRVTERRIAGIRKQIKQIKEETESFPHLIENSRQRIGRLEAERKLLKSGPLIKQLNKIMELAEG